MTRRLLPLYAAAALLNIGFWVPVEKLFMNEIGFDAATVGLMAAAYAALVPVIEVPSGILADRWSRRGMLVVSAVALSVSVLIGGVSHSVTTYILGAMVLSVFFAMYSGTTESIVYDVVLEETGSGAGFQKQIGRVRMVESVALVSSALAGGWIASLASTRLTYFLTVPFTLAAIVALLRFREPRLHKAGEHSSLKEHLRTTYDVVLRRTTLVPVIVLAVLTAMTMSVLFEFGPLWLVALSAAAVLYGPFWAGLVSSVGLGGLLASRLRLDRPVQLAVVVALMLSASVALTMSHSIAVVTAAQVVLALLVMTVSIHTSQLLHDAVPSAIRTGVASGVSAMSWIAFLPFALVFGAVSKEYGVHTAGWMIVAAVALAGVVLVVLAARARVRCEDEQPDEDPAVGGPVADPLVQRAA